MLASDTSPPTPPPAAKPPRRLRWLVGAPVLLLTLAAGGWLGLQHSTTGKRAALATGYIAHVVCS